MTIEIYQVIYKKGMQFLLLSYRVTMQLCKNLCKINYLTFELLFVRLSKVNTLLRLSFGV